MTYFLKDTVTNAVKVGYSKMPTNAKQTCSQRTPISWSCWAWCRPGFNMSRVITKSLFNPGCRASGSNQTFWLK
jgi:hypothetical protein